MSRVFLLAAIVSAVACSGGSAPTAVGEDPLTGEAAGLEKTARSLRLNWFEAGKVANIGSAKGKLTKAPGDGTDPVGKAGFQELRMDNEDDGIPTITVTASFQPYLIVKQLDCPTCTMFVAGKQTATGFEIRDLRVKDDGTLVGPVVGPHDAGHFQIFITSVDNLKASVDERTIGKAVTEGDYTLTTSLE